MQGTRHDRVWTVIPLLFGTTKLQVFDAETNETAWYRYSLIEVEPEHIAHPDLPKLVPLEDAHKTGEAMEVPNTCKTHDAKKQRSKRALNAFSFVQLRPLSAMRYWRFCGTVPHDQHFIGEFEFQYQGAPVIEK